MQTRALLLDAQTDRGDLIAGIERALALASSELALAFEHDGAETQGDIVYTVWSDDVKGTTETSWVRLTDDKRANALYLEINATTETVLETVNALVCSNVQVLGRIPSE